MRQLQLLIFASRPLLLFLHLLPSGNAQTFRYMENASMPGLLPTMIGWVPQISGSQGVDRAYGTSADLVKLPGNSFVSAVMFGARSLGCGDVGALTFLHFDPAGWRWETFNPTITGMRANWIGAATLVVYDRHMVVFNGGHCSVGCWNTMFVLDLGRAVSTNAAPPADCGMHPLVKYSDTEAYFVQDKVYRLDMTNVNATTNPSATWTTLPAVTLTAKAANFFGVDWSRMKLGITTNRTLFSIAYDTTNSRIVLETLDLNLNTPVKSFVIPNILEITGGGQLAVRRIGDSTFLMADNQDQNKFFIFDLANLTLYKPLLSASLLPPSRMGFTSVVVNNSYVIMNGHNGATLTTPSVYAIKFNDDCPPRFYRSSVFCYECPMNMYCPDGTNMFSCPSNSVSAPRSKDISQCICTDQFTRFKNTCCPVRYQCTDAGTVCQAGYGYDAGRLDCVACVSGVTYKSAVGNSSCTACPVGSLCSNISFTCLSGFGINGDQSACVSCGVTNYKDSPGNVPCTPCPLNAICTSTGYQCQPGYTLVAGTRCEACNPGTFKTTASNASCSLCPTGTYQPQSGQLNCIDCPVNATCTLGSSQFLCMSGFKMSENQLNCISTTVNGPPNVPTNTPPSTAPTNPSSNFWIQLWTQNLLLALILVSSFWIVLFILGFVGGFCTGPKRVTMNSPTVPISRMQTGFQNGPTDLLQGGRNLSRHSSRHSSSSRSRYSDVNRSRRTSHDPPSRPRSGHSRR